METTDAKATLASPTFQYRMLSSPFIIWLQVSLDDPCRDTIGHTIYIYTPYQETYITD